MKSASAVLVVAFLGAYLGTWPAFSATHNSSFSVTLNAQSTCQIDSRSQELRNTSVAAANPWSLVSVSCSNPTPYDVSLTAGRIHRATRSEAQINASNSAAMGYLPGSTAANSIPRTGLHAAHAIGSHNEFARAFTADDEALGLRHVDIQAEADTLVFTIIY